MTPGLYTNLTSEQYHAAPGISNSGLGIIAERTPAHYQASLTTPRKDTPAKQAGSRLHYALLEPDQFESRYAPIPDIDKRTREGKAAQAAWEEANVGKLPINPAEREQVLRVRDRLLSDANVRTLLTGGIKERSVFALDPVTGELVKCRPDVDHDAGPRWLADLKSTENASRDDFMWSAYRYGYHRQAALYLDVCAWEGSLAPPEDFFFIAFEKEPPYGYIIYEAAKPFISRGRDAYRAALDIYASCRKSGVWPDYDRGIQSLDLPEVIHKRLDAADNDEIVGITYVR